MARILVVDDEPAIRAVIANALTHEGHTVHEAAHGGEGLELLEREPVDLVILDIYMPTKDGLETLRVLRMTKPALKILAMSGVGQVGKFEPLKIAEKLGADCILEKPFDIEELAQLVSSCVA